MPNKKLMRLSEVATTTSLSKASIYRLIAKNKFPRPIKITINRVAWVDAEIQEWIKKQNVSSIQTEPKRHNPLLKGC